MIGTDEMSSSTGMDISETFRPEDISKSDFFDFVTATEMGIGVVGIGGVGVGVSLQTAQHQQYAAQQQQQQQQLQHQSTHQQSQNHERLSTSSNMTHDGGGTSANRSVNNGSNTNNNSISNGNTSDPTLQSYEFWHTEKDSSRLDSSIFEDLDRFCWQQPTTPTTSTAAAAAAASISHQPTQHLQTPAIPTHNSNNNNNNSNNTNLSNQCDPLNVRATQSAQTNAVVSQPNSSPSTTTTLQDNDGQIYTITVLNGGAGTGGAGAAGGNEPTTPTASTSWLKRETDESQLPSTLDLDSLLGNFSGYIKSEYPYDDSGFSTDGTKSDGLNGDVNGINSIQQQQQQFGNSAGNNGQALPSLVMSGFRAGLNIGQHLAAQFQNNNNDWHMMDHNAAEQSSAESLLRSALQGKGYTKGPHQMPNGGITALLPTGSPTVKDDEMRRMLFSAEADSLTFADSTLNASQMFDESPHHAQLLQLQHTTTTPNGSLSQSNQAANSNLMVDDMFLTLENAFSDDFDKMKRIASEVQQYCHTPPIESDYMSTDLMMQISPPTPTTPVPPGSNQLQPLHSPIAPNLLATTQPTSPLTAANAATTLQLQQRKAEVTNSAVATATPATASASSGSRSINPTKATKKYKRAISSNTTNTNNNNSSNSSLNALSHNNNNNNGSSTTNPTNNNNNNTSGTTPTAKNASCASSSNNSATSSGSSSSSSNSPPTSHCNGQRKERSLHYCSICSKGFKDKYSVNVHIRTHTGEKPFACSLCGKSFRQKAHLAKHYQTHMAQKNNHGGGGGGGGGGLVKSNAAKHHRGGAAMAAAAQQQQQQQQRQQLSMLTSNPSNAQMSSQMGGGLPNTGGGGAGLSINSGALSLGGLGTMGLNPNLLGVTSTVVSLNGPANSACLSANLLASNNGLLTNR